MDSPIKDRQSRNGEYLLSLDVDRLVHNFRVNAEIQSDARPYGGWESPECGLRGHFVGHYLSACALMWSSTGEEAFRRRAHQLILALQDCQRRLPGGYLAAFPMAVFDVLEKEFGGVWAWLNDVLGMQHPHQRGGYIYSHPLCGCRKIYGEPEDAFWCCYGTTVDAYSRLADGIYSMRGTDCIVNQFIASTVELPDKKLTIEQRTSFPYEPRTSLVFRGSASVQLAVRIRKPAWCEAQSLNLNGEAIEAATEDGYAIVSRLWQPGDCLQVELPMRLHVETLPGDSNMAAVLYGPVVLAARTPHAAELGCTSDELLQQVRIQDQTKLHFSLRLVFGGVVPLVPLNEIVDEAFSAYFRTRPPG